jgi:putative hemolysin
VSDLLRLLAVFGLVAANAFFVIGEYAVVTARRGALTTRAEAGSAGARVALRLMDDPVRVISTVQVGITALGILTGAIGEPLIRDVVGDGLPGWLSFAIAFGFVTYLSVVFGELVPKAVTLARAETLAALVAPPVQLLSVILRPAVWVLQGSARVLLRPFGLHDVAVGAVRTTDELRAIVDEAEGAGVIPRAQEEMLHNVFDFADREVRDIMTPALDVDWLEADLTPTAALDQAVESPHERYPVARGSLDKLVGTVIIHELLAAQRADGNTRVAGLARQAFVVPETKDVGALLRDFREQREQLAVVVDEYGDVAGIVTIEDIMEELVGEIEDEFDLPDSTLRWVDDRSVLVAGSMTIDDFNEQVHTHLPQDGPRTLAGLVLDALGRRPDPGDVVDIGDVQIKVDALDGLRITELQVTLPEPRETREESPADA